MKCDKLLSSFAFKFNLRRYIPDFSFSPPGKKGADRLNTHRYGHGRAVQVSPMKAPETKRSNQNNIELFCFDRVR